MENSRLAMTVRYLLGVGMAFFGINGFLQFVTPPELSSSAIEFFSAIANTGYLFEFTNIIFIIRKSIMIIIPVFSQFFAKRHFPVFLKKK